MMFDEHPDGGMTEIKSNGVDFLENAYSWDQKWLKSCELKEASKDITPSLHKWIYSIIFTRGQREWCLTYWSVPSDEGSNSTNCVAVNMKLLPDVYFDKERKLFIHTCYAKL